MKILKKLILALISLIALILIAALFMKKDYAVEREIVINKPKQEVFNYIKYLKNQDHYSKWNNVDPDMKKMYRGTDGEVGSVAGWDSQNDQVGAGEQEILKMVDGERIDLALRFTRPFVANDNAYFITEAVSEGQTKVKWGFNGKMNWPMNIMLKFMNLEEMLGSDLQTGLTALKPLVEAIPAPVEVMRTAPVAEPAVVK